MLEGNNGQRPPTEKEAKDALILEIKSQRQRLATEIDELKKLLNAGLTAPAYKELETAQTRLHESRMWLGMALQALNVPDPYPKGNDPTTTEIDPPADMPGK